nr:hypothetical protein [Tanacetum cinerariifolium]
CRCFEPLTILLFGNEALEIPCSYRDEPGHHRVMQQQGSDESCLIRRFCLAPWLAKLPIKVGQKYWLASFDSAVTMEQLA